MIEGGIVNVIKVPTEINLSDPLSKVMKVVKTQRFMLSTMMDVGYKLPGYQNSRLLTT